MRGPSNMLALLPAGHDLRCRDEEPASRFMENAPYEMDGQANIVMSIKSSVEKTPQHARTSGNAAMHMMVRLGLVIDEDSCNPEQTPWAGQCPRSATIITDVTGAARQSV